MALRVKIVATDKLSSTVLRIGRNVLRLGTQFVKMGALAATAISAIAIKLQKDLDIGLREIGTLMDGLTNNQMKAMTQELERLAAQSGQAIKPLLTAKYDIISAGFNSAAESALLLEKAVILATAGVTNVAIAGDLLTTVLNAFGKEAKEAEDIINKLFLTVKLGKTTIDRMGGSFGRILGIAASVGFSFEEISAALATLTVSLGSTELAVTAINGSIIALLQPSEKLNKIIKKTEFATIDAMVAALGYSGSLDLIKKTAVEANVPMKDLFTNTRALMSILPLTSTQMKMFNENIAQYEHTAGIAAKASDEIMKSFQKVTDRLKRNVENMLRSLGRELIAKIQPKIEAFNTEMEKMGELNWQKLAQIFSDNWSIILFTLGKMAFVGGRIIATKLFESIEEHFSKLATTLTVIGKVFEILFTSAQVMAIENARTAKSVEELEKELEDLGKSLVDLLIPAFEEIEEKVVITDIAFAKLSDRFKNLAHDMRTDAQILSKILKEMWDALSDPEALDKMQQITTAIGDVYGNFLNLRKAQIQSELDTQIKAVLASGLAEEEKQAKILNLREQAAQKEKEFAKKLKPIRMAQAIAGTALAVINALQTKPFIPLGLIAGGLAAAAGAAEIATIAAQPFAHGGFVRMGGNVPAGDTIPAMLSPNEIVSTPAASEQFGAEIARFNQIAESGFGENGGGNFVITAMDSQSFLEAVRRDPGKFKEAMQLIDMERY